MAQLTVELVTRICLDQEPWEAWCRSTGSGPRSKNQHGWTPPPRLPEVSLMTRDTVWLCFTVALTKAVTATRHGRLSRESCEAGVKRQRVGHQQRWRTMCRAISTSSQVNWLLNSTKSVEFVERQTNSGLMSFIKFMSRLKEMWSVLL